ncbi:hypothetical protein PInf_019993 [Phytophthora infestans]|nr:hypothetical protein PInf_019993 [Phytophthora infestans]
MASAVPSGVKAVVKIVGDHGCEYMTGGHVAVLGSTGRNFAAGMSHRDQTFQEKCNMGMVGFRSLTETASDAESQEVKTLISKHAERTQSPKAQRVLDNWDASVHKFMRVMAFRHRAITAAAVKETKKLVSSSV